MEVLVINYTDWIGYHIVEALLNEGYSVKALAGKNGNVNVEDFFARNSAFSLYEKQQDIPQPLVICIGESEEWDGIKMERLILINSMSEVETEKKLSIDTPFLFGEWMPMDEKGFYRQGERIYFSSELFKKEGIYIADFIKLFLQWVKEATKLNDVTLKSARNLENRDIKLDNFFLVHENIPIEENIRRVITHFQMHHSLYPEKN